MPEEEAATRTHTSTLKETICLINRDIKCVERSNVLLTACDTSRLFTPCNSAVSFELYLNKHVPTPFISAWWHWRPTTADNTNIVLHIWQNLHFCTHRHQTECQSQPWTKMLSNGHWQNGWPTTVRQRSIEDTPSDKQTLHYHNRRNKMTSRILILQENKSILMWKTNHETKGSYHKQDERHPFFAVISTCPLLAALLPGLLAAFSSLANITPACRDLSKHRLTEWLCLKLPCITDGSWDILFL